MKGALAGVKGLVLDLDGTVYQYGRPLPGAADFLRALDAGGVPWVFCTNTTSRSRATLARELDAMGIPVEPAKILTAAVVGRERLLREGLSRCLAVVTDALREDLAGLELDAPEPQAVVIGDAGDGFTFQRLNEAFLALQGGARLVALAKNRYFSFRSGGGLTLDCGPFVAALEYAARCEAILVGKPSTLFFQAAFQAVGVPPGQVAVIGDDVESDVAGGQAAGARGILVRTGKFRGADLQREIRPHAVVDSLGALTADV